MFKSSVRGTAKGFTLIELLVVIAIIGILSSVVLASLNDARLKSRDAKRVSDIKQLQLALELHYDSVGDYPDTLAALTPTYIPAVPTDPIQTAAYSYTPLGASGSCTSYHLGANLEQATHAALNADVDGAVSLVVCTALADFAGADVSGTTCAGAAVAGRVCYDVKP